MIREMSMNKQTMRKQESKKLEREKIEQEITKCMQDIDKKYYNPNFNLMGEIVNIFGDINWEKVKLDIERLNKIDEKLDKVTKLIVDEHSEEFYKILGFVRQMQKEIETAKLKTIDARDVLSNINTIISNLSTGENSDWKLKSFYCTEIISKLNKTQQIFKIIQDCEVFTENSKIFDAIILLKRSYQDHVEYDKEFRNFNFLVSINMRFGKIKENIEEKIIQNLNNILFFTQENVLERKISSLFNYFLNYYSKISIDNELTKPLQKFMYMTHAMVNQNLQNYNFDLDLESNNIDNYFKDNIIDLDSEKKLSSLIYLIKCLKNYDKSFNIFLKFNEKINENLSNLLERTVKFTAEGLKNVDFSKYDLDNKTDKIKFLLFFQVILMIFFHLFCKIVALNNYLRKNDISELIEKLFLAVEKIILLPLIVYNKISAPLQNSQDQSIELYAEFLQGESIIRMKINEVLTNNIENLPILYKIYNKFTETSHRLLITIRLYVLANQLNNYNLELYQYFSKKIIPKKFFDINTFLTDYDGEISNFKFIQEFTFKINKLKDLLVFSFDSGYLELLKIFKDMFNKFCEETKTFFENLKSKCAYNLNFQNLFDEFIKMKEFNDISPKLEFKKYEKNFFQKEDSNSKYNSKFNNILTNLIHSAGKTPPENLVLLTRNYKLMELITKFIYCSEILINVGENFVFDLMKQEFSNPKITALLEQINTMHFVDLKDKDNIDLSSLIMMTLRILEKLSGEVTKLILICKIEFTYLISTLIRNICKNEYWLHEPQMTPEYFVNAFINEFNVYNNLFQFNLNDVEYQFIIKDFLLLVNNTFICCLKNINSNSINNFGVNLMIRNFDHIREKIGADFKFEDPEIKKTIFYFPNYIKLLNLSGDSITEQLMKYYEIRQYDVEFIIPLINIRTNSRQTLNDLEKSKIIKSVFK